MNLQKKSVLVFALLLIGFLLIITLFFSTILLASYRTLEEGYIEKDLDQTVKKLNDELYTMSSIASDWGPWDDTVDFVNGKAPNYLNSNLRPYGFDNLNLNLIIITNTQGIPLFSGSYDLQKKVMIPVPDYFSGPIDLKNPLMNMSDPHQVTRGILLLPEDPILLVSQPIVHSDYSGPPQGVIIMGRYLNQEEISRLAALTRPSLTLTRIDDKRLPKNLVSQIREKSRLPGEIIIPLNPDQVAGYALIPDIFGDDALVLQITETRDIYHQGIETTIQVIFLILVGGLFLGLMVIILLDRIVLKRMGSLAQQVNKIGQSGSTTEPVVITGDDELSGLADEINRMLKTIEQTQQKVQASEAQFRDLVEYLPDYIIVCGLNGEIQYINPAAVRALGYDVETMVGRSVLSYIPEEFHNTMMARFAGHDEFGEMTTDEIDLLTHNGLRKSVIVKETKVRYHNDPAIFLLLIDITRRKELEKEREDHAQELQRYSTSLHQANIKLRLLTGLTRHDALNKLSAMQILHGLAMETSDEATNHDYISHAHQAGERMKAIIGFTQEYENFGTVSCGWERIHPIIESAKTEVSLKGAIVENEIPEDLEVYADPIIRKVFTTLLENAVRHGGNISTIRIFCSEQDNALIITCEDDGTGIVIDEKEFIFNRGYGKHTGVGLFLSREILSITELSIRETGEQGKGARFEITVPQGKYKRAEW
ncbi:MAG TPA: CHASE4 domain-containing protein [Methanospirillum sp.]|nr:CHASE4 domain-containing protein [Methanospirillum sp.]